MCSTFGGIARQRDRPFRPRLRQIAPQLALDEVRKLAVAGVGEDYVALRRKMWDEARNGALKMPVLLVAGKDDGLDWGANDATAHLTGELGLYDIIGTKNTRVQMDVINDGGHFMYREHPELFNNDLIHFIEFWEHPSAAKAGM